MLIAAAHEQRGKWLKEKEAIQSPMWLPQLRSAGETAWLCAKGVSKVRQKHSRASGYQAHSSVRGRSYRSQACIPSASGSNLATAHVLTVNRPGMTKMSSEGSGGTTRRRPQETLTVTQIGVALNAQRQLHSISESLYELHPVHQPFKRGGVPVLERFASWPRSP